MAGSTISKALEAKFGVDVGPLRRGMRKADRIVQRGSRTMKRAFAAVASAAAALGAAIAAAVARGVQKAAELEESLTRLETLVGINSDQVGRWRDEILKLAPAVGKGPKELSEAMFAITSGGARGAEALETLRQSAKASAIGLGSMTDIGRTATAAMQAFGDEGLTATEAIDQMVATVRTGNVETDKLTGALGKVIGIADSMGVSFADMNAFIATFTRLGVEARVASTSLRATLNAMAKPTTDQKAAFQELGTSVAGFREEIQQKGLAQALRDLIQRSQGNIETLSRLVPNVRALSGVLGTASAQGETFSDVQAQIRDAMGLTNEGFREARKDLNLLIDRLKAAKDVLLIRVGEQFAPFVERFLGDPENIKLVADAFVGSVQAMLASIQGLMNAGRTLNSFARDTFFGRIFGLERSTRGKLGEAGKTREQLRGLLDQIRTSVPEGGTPVRDLLPQVQAALGRELPKDLTRGGLEDAVVAEIQRITQEIDKEGGLVDQLGQVNDRWERANRLMKEARQRLERINTGQVARSVASGAGAGGSSGGGGGFSPHVGTLRALGLTAPGRGATPGGGTGGPLPGGALGPGAKVMGRAAREGINDVLSGTLDTVEEESRSTAEIIGNTLIPAFSQLGALMGDTASKVLNAATQIASSIARIISSSAMSFGGFGGIATLASGALTAIGGFFEKGGVVPHAQSGMVVPGRGAVPIVAHSGEVVLNRETVQSLGGPQAANQMNQQSRGRVTDGVDDRGGGRPINLTVNVSGSGGRSVADQVQEAIEDLERKGRLPG